MSFPMQAGGFVHDGRVNGTLNLSRALGDMEFKRGTQLAPAEQVHVSLGLIITVAQMSCDPHLAQLSHPLPCKRPLHQRHL